MVVLNKLLNKVVIFAFVEDIKEGAVEVVVLKVEVVEDGEEEEEVQALVLVEEENI